MRHLILPTILAAAALAACSSNDAPPPAAEVPQPILQGEALRFPPNHPQLALLRTTKAAPGKSISVELPARLVWNEERTQRFYAPFAGRVMKIAADVGQPVKPGTLLAQMASPDFGQAQSDTAQAQSDLRLTGRALARQRELFAAGIVARKDLEQVESDAERAEAEASRAAVRVKLYGNSGVAVNQQLAISSGIAGFVVERNLNPGQELRPDQSGAGVPALFVVSDPSVLWVQIDAREAEVGSLLPGAVFELRVPAYPGQTFVGKVAAASDFIDPATRTIKVRGVVDNPQRLLKAEMLATARFDRALGAGVVVPAAAVILRGEKHWVFVQTQPGAFELREVGIGHQGPAEVVVSRGLEVGDAVVSENVLLLARQLRIAQDDAKAPARPEAAASGTAKAAKP